MTLILIELLLMHKDETLLTLFIAAWCWLYYLMMKMHFYKIC